MIWDYSHNRPYGQHRKTAISPENFRKEVEEWLVGEKGQWLHDENESEEVRSRKEDIINQNIKYALETVNYDLDQFMLTHAYYQITDPYVRNCFLIYECLIHSPSTNLIQYNMDEYAEGYDIHILTKAEDMRWGNKKDVSDADIMCRYYFCETEEDIWDIFADGVGNIYELCRWYRKESKDKAMQALLYIYGDNDKLVNAVTGKTYLVCPESVKEEVVSILTDEFFEGMFDSFFNEDNYERALIAWETGIPEIRKEFVRNDHAVKMLKKILSQ
jgi:hypothetical protein